MNMKKRIHSIAIRAGYTFVVFFVIPNLALYTPANCSPKVLKEMAMTEFEAANYPRAIEYLQQALNESPDDAEIFYLLGYYKHYLCYDSVPLMGYTRESSDEVLRYLQKAVELDPGYGDAFYFIGAEYGVRARDEMQKGNSEGVAEQFRLGQQAGGYPDWLIEYGRNTLRSCDRDAILFVGGDADTNPIQYLQNVLQYRTDVTVIPVALLDRPWFVSLLKQGMENVVAPAPISWSSQQIASMRPYKWKANTIRVPIPNNIRLANGLKQTCFEWELRPDLGRGETLGLLSAKRAVIADIILSNRWKRPIYYSMACGPSAWDGLQQNLRCCGLAQQLLPFEPLTRIDVKKTQTLLLNKNNFESLSTLCDENMPRVSYMLQNYRVSFFWLINHYVRNNNIESGRTVFAAMTSNVPEEIIPVSEGIKNNFESLENILENRE